MKIVNRISFLFLFMAILILACQKENIDKIIPEDPDYQIDTIDVNPLLSQMTSTSSDFLEIDCVNVPYPVEFLQASGSTITINSSAELDDALMLSDSIVDFVYPIEATDDSGMIIIENFEDLVTAITLCITTIADCADLKPHILLFFNALNIFSTNKYEYQINYPVTLIVEGDEIVINNGDQYLPAVTVDGSPNRLLQTDLVYPITIRQFGRDIVLNSDEDVCQFYDTLDEPCENKPPHIQFFFKEGVGVPINCAYVINYPVSIILNGETIDIQSGDDYRNTLNSSPSNYDNIELVYPVGIYRLQGQPEDVVFEEDADICLYLNNCE